MDSGEYILARAVGYKVKSWEVDFAVSRGRNMI
jgi:hypothetical protein